MTVFLKHDNSKGIGEKCFYFTDGANNLSENFTYVQAHKQIVFLKTLGIKVSTEFKI